MSGYEGLRVLRGPDWENGDVDGGEGYLGTVINFQGNDTVNVLWDMGQESLCSTGHNGKFELLVFDTSAAGVRHSDTRCSECGEVNISGILWRCQDCIRCDLCSRCYSDDKHETRHQFLRIASPAGEGHPVSKRKTSVKVRSIGIHPGSKVVRGKYWEWGNQDGGEGSEGKVKAYNNENPNSSRDIVRVEWPHGVVTSCRLGLRGKVDLKCVEEEIGPFYYRDHLPLLDTTKPSQLNLNTSSQVTEDNLSQILPESENNADIIGRIAAPEVAPATRDFGTLGDGSTAPERMGEETDAPSLNLGDKVTIQVGEEKLKDLQKTSGGYTARMLRCVGRIGEVTDISPKGVVSVKFGISQISYRLNPRALLKIESVFSAGDTVRIRGDLDLVKVLNARIGWSEDKDKTVNKVGRVVRVDADGDVRVDFNGCQYVYAPACCVSAADADVDTLSGADGGNGTSAAEDRRETENMAMFRKFRDAIMGESYKSQGRNNRALFEAIEFEDLDSIRDMCQRDATMVEKEYQGITPLIYASLRGRRACAELLLDLGADVNRTARDDVRKTPMSAVLEGKREELAELLLSRGADTKVLYDGGHALAHLAVVRNKTVILRALAKYGADLNVKDDRGNTPLHLAIELRRDAVMRLLVELPQVDVQVGNKRDFDPIQLACYVDNVPALERLLARDCSRVERLRSGHSSALLIAATNNHVECIRLLVINGGANINSSGPNAMTSLHVACHRAKLEAVETLLELGAEVNVQDKDGDTPLHLAIGGKIEGYGKSEKAEVEVARRISICNMLISRGAFVDAENNHRRHPFSYGRSVVRSGVRAFVAHNKDIVQRKTGKSMESVLESLNDSDNQSNIQGRRLGEALKGLRLPCGLCGNPKADVTLQPCQHKCVCSSCSGKVDRCPLCDGEVADRVYTGQDGKTLDAKACKQM